MSCVIKIQKLASVKSLSNNVHKNEYLESTYIIGLLHLIFQSPSCCRRCQKPQTSRMSNTSRYIAQLIVAPLREENITEFYIKYFKALYNGVKRYSIELEEKKTAALI